jgi:prolyl-tRNA editing enzyme YbaK/EbsC (Cys-tRNA(Pro) deacylase)
MVELHAEQQYITDLAQKLGIETKLVEHDKHTETCYEKAELLGWDPARVIKAVYFHKDDHVVGIITPELGEKIPVRDVLPAVLPEISRKKAKSYSNHYAPEGMAFGTCTPFPQESIMSQGIDHLIIYDHPSIDDQLVDVSIGGREEPHFRTSMHLPYSGIYAILAEQFPGHVSRYTNE